MKLAPVVRHNYYISFLLPARDLIPYNLCQFMLLQNQKVDRVHNPNESFCEEHTIATHSTDSCRWRIASPQFLNTLRLGFLD